MREVAEPVVWHNLVGQYPVCLDGGEDGQRQPFEELEAARERILTVPFTSGILTAAQCKALHQSCGQVGRDQADQVVHWVLPFCPFFFFLACRCFASSTDKFLP